MNKEALKSALLSVLLSTPAVFVVWAFSVFIFIDLPNMDTGQSANDNLIKKILAGLGAAVVIAIAIKEYKRKSRQK